MVTVNTASRIAQRARRLIRRLWQRALRPLEQRREAARLTKARRAVLAFPTCKQQRPHGLPAPLIVSLTSYPPRFPTLAATLKSLLDQQVRADHILLWIAERDLDLLPDEVLALRAHGLDIRPCADLRSYKKLIPCLEAFPDSYVVTADDDVHYPPDWLATLVDAVDPAAPAIIARRAHLARFDRDGRAAPYLDWSLDTQRRRSPGLRTLLFPTGVGGILYPPRALPPEALDIDAFTALCPDADDIWFFWMARRNGMSHVRVAGQFPLTCWPNSQQAALFITNRLNQGNDSQMRNLEAHYGPLVAGQD